MVQAIPRHSDLGTTLAFYVITPESETRDAHQEVGVCVANEAADRSLLDPTEDPRNS